MGRRHNCEADSNKRMLGLDERGDEIVTVFGCRRCPRTWEVARTSAQIDAEMRERQIAAIEIRFPELARQMRAQG
jgi:hypothetical protein